jgi:hypothetical protein
MTSQATRMSRRKAIFSVTLLAMTMTATVLPAHAAQRPERVGPEVKVGGLTIAEQHARQLQLYRELAAQLPAGVDRTPLRVEITEADKNDLLSQPLNGNAPLRVGVVKSLASAVGKPSGKAFNYGLVKNNPNGSLVWAMTVTSPGAQAIRLHITDFSLPANTEMYFMSATGQVDGPYTGVGRNENGDFWTRSVASETGQLVLRYTGNRPEADMPRISFLVSEVAHIRGRPPRPQEQSHDTWPCSDNAVCLIDVNCVDTGPAAPAENAVAKMEWIQGPFIYTCTGGLLADTDASTQIPYFLSANHCLTSSNSNLETFFEYKTNTCNGACPDSLVTGGTPPPASTVGVTVVATGKTGDFTLMTLNQPPPAGTVFLGWNNTPVANANGTDLYRISNPNFGPEVYSAHAVDTSSPTCTGWPRGERIYSKDLEGATMGGSSGSPVLNSAGEVVGQLSGCCGYDCNDVCDKANNWTVDGALAFYWNSVAGFLNPQGGCTADAECDDGLFCTGTETCVSGSCQSSGDPCSGGTTCNEATDSCDTPVCNNDGTCGPGEDCSNCPNDCRGQTSGKPSSRYCCDGDLPGCGDSRCSANGWSCGGGGGGGGCTSNAQCDDGLFCDGIETCSSSGTCQSGSNPCPGQACNETSDMCVTCAGNKQSCTTNSDCCSGACLNGKCRGN